MKRTLTLKLIAVFQLIVCLFILAIIRYNFAFENLNQIINLLIGILGLIFIFKKYQFGILFSTIFWIFNTISCLFALNELIKLHLNNDSDDIFTLISLIVIIIIKFTISIYLITKADLIKNKKYFYILTFLTLLFIFIEFIKL